jgi:hypothetical protein
LHLEEKFENIKGILRMRYSKKDREHNGILRMRNSKKDREYKGCSECVIQRRTENTMGKSKITKGKTTFYKTSHIKLKIEQHEPH